MSKIIFKVEYFVFFPLQSDLRAILGWNINKSVEANINWL